MDTAMMKSLCRLQRVENPFINGFIWGLAAPVMVFSYQSLDAPRAPNRDVGSYWKSVGGKLRTSAQEIERERRKAAFR